MFNTSSKSATEHSNAECRAPKLSSFLRFIFPAMHPESTENSNLFSEEETRQGISVTDEMRRRSSLFWFMLLAVLGAAGYFRFHDLSERSLWFDEAFSWRMIQLPWSEIPAATANDTHPPLYYFLLKIWSGVFGDSLFALRSLSAILGIVTVLGVYLFAMEAYGTFCRDDREEAGNRAHLLALLAAALAAFSPFQITHARELRMYPLVVQRGFR